MKLTRAALAAVVLAAALIGTLLPAAGDTAGSVASLIAIDGAIGPATARYVKEGLDAASERGAEVVILRLNTPGGLVASMRDIIADILASPVPVVGFVAPSGAHAASAGTYILYATHVAVMAPGTNLGAATPVEIGGGLPGMPNGGDEKNGSPPSASSDPMAAKMTNDAVAFIRSLAELRGRNADWAEKAVREAASFSANAALDAHVVDLIAADPSDLLNRIDGRLVHVAGSERRLQTRGLAVETFEPGWVISVLGLITDPNLAVFLLLIGFYGLIFEFSTPGAVAPGVVGTICLLLGLYGLNMLPIDYAGLVLMLLGILFLVIEAFNPTVVLGLGGLLSFVLGASMLFKVEAPGYHLSWTFVALVAAMIAGLVVLTGRSLWTIRRRPPRLGPEAMSGAPARIIDWRGKNGHVLAEGERWQAEGEPGLSPGETVEVAAVRDLTLVVRRPPDTAASKGGLP